MPSLAARLIDHIVLPLLGSKRLMGDEERFARAIARKVRPAPPPPARMARAFAIAAAQSDAGFTVYTVAPRAGALRARVLYLHGGAYVYELGAAHWAAVARLVRATGASVTVPVYPLAPRYNHRDAFALLLPLCERLGQLRAQGRWTLMGDSAGGGLALALAQALRARGMAQPDQLILLCPWLDLSMRDPAAAALSARDNMLAIPGLRWAGRAWAGGAPTTDPAVSPLYGALAGLPPMTVFSGTADLLNADARRLQAKALAEGAPLRYEEVADMFHGWMGAPIAEALPVRQAVAAIISA